MSANHPLRSWRLAKDLSVEQVAALINVDAATVRSYETGRRIPRPQIMVRIEAVTLRGVTASDFLPATAPAVPRTEEVSTNA